MAQTEKSGGDAAIAEAERANNAGQAPIPLKTEKLLPLLVDMKSRESEIAEMRGDLSGYWKQYEAAGGLKDVGRVIKKLSKMTESQRADWGRQFEQMWAAAFGADTADMFDEPWNVVPMGGSAAAAAE